MKGKQTFTCKACGGEHAGLICTKFLKERSAVVALLPAPKKKKPAKAAP